MDVIDLLPVLRCPNTGQTLHVQDGHLVSQDGDLRYRIVAPDFIDMRPAKPATLKGACRWIDTTDFYRTQLAKPMDLGYRESEAWGILSSFPVGYRNFIELEMKAIAKAAEPTPRRILLDLSGGCGTFTFGLASLFDHVIHFDLYDQSMNYAWHRARDLGLRNVLFVRGDYFQLPFAPGSISMVISTDAFIYYSTEDDLSVLRSASDLLAPQGAMFVDFHNKKPWRQNPDIHEYTRQEADYLARHLPGATIERLCGVPTALLRGPFKTWLFKLPLTPSVRWALSLRR